MFLIIELKAHQIWEKRQLDGREGTSQSDWEEARQYLEEKKNRQKVCQWKFFRRITLWWEDTLVEDCLESIEFLLEKLAFFTILGRLGQLAFIVAVVSFVFGEKVRRNNEVFAAWTAITTAHDQTGSGGRKRALEFLNSRPLRFPWIWVTRDLFWDGEKCKEKLVFGRRWRRETLAGLSAPKAYLFEINLCGAGLAGANLQKAKLWNANLQQAYLYRANLQNANLREAKLQDADLYSANLQNANLREAKLQDALLEGANLQRADLFEVNLQRANLFEANLQKANLEKANLQNAELFEANLQGADLSLANLQTAYLFEANLQNANLRGANLQSTYLNGANLQEAILIDTQNLTPKQIKSACFWERAIYKGEWDEEEQTWVAIEPDNIDYIEELKNDIISNSDEPIDCSDWEKEN